MTTYRVLASDDLLRQPGLRWPAGFRVVELGPVLKLADSPGGWQPVRELTVTDDDAPAELAGRLVEVTFARNALSGAVTVESRTAVDG